MQFSSWLWSAQQRQGPCRLEDPLWRCQYYAAKCRSVGGGAGCTRAACVVKHEGLAGVPFPGAQKRKPRPSPVGVDPTAHSGGPV